MPPKKSNAGKTAPPSGLIQGRVSAHRDGFGFVSAEPDDIYLNKHEMRQVFNGDLVSVKPGPQDDRGRREGVIVEVIERRVATLAGQYLVDGHQAFLKAEGMAGGPDIWIRPQDANSARHGQMVVAEIVEHPTAFRPAYAKVTEILGDKMDAGVEIQVAIRRFEIPHQWPKGVEADAERFGPTVKDSDKKNRLDLRNKPFVTIDGADARDFDDAVLCEPDGKGWKLWVAIADVSHYVKPGTALDREAENRATSVYFPDHVVPMLPEAISNGLCSLNPEVDRLTMVCEMDISAKGEVTAYRFAEAVINSHARLTYDRAFQIIEEKSQAEQPTRSELGAVISNCVDRLSDLFEVLFAARQKRGAMEFETVETRIVFDRNRKISRIDPVTRNRAHRIIEECMLCANVCTANLFQTLELPALYRVHESPVNDRLNNLRDYLAQLGLSLGGGEKPRPKDFKILADQIIDRPDRSVVQTQVLRSMQQAVYQPENLGHFGLAYDGYTHFTSPIRRYPDLLVHRAIRHLLHSKRKSPHLIKSEGWQPLRKKDAYPYDEAALVKLGIHCSMAERRADEATRDVIQWLKCEYLLEHVGTKHIAIVAAVTHFGLFVELQDLYIEGLIHITALPSDYYEYDAARMQLIGRSSKRIFALGNKVLVQIARVNLDERKIDLVLADSSSESGQGGLKNSSSPRLPSGPKKKSGGGDSGRSSGKRRRKR